MVAPQAERYGSASSTPSLETEGREGRRAQPPLPHPRHRRNPRSKPRSDSETPSAVESTSLSGANSPGYTKPLPFVSLRVHSWFTRSGGSKGTTDQRTKGPDPCESASIRGCPPRSDTGAHHEPHRLEQKTGKFGKACRRFLIRNIGEIRGQSRGAVRESLRPSRFQHDPRRARPPKPWRRRAAAATPSRSRSCPFVSIRGSPHAVQFSAP